MKTFAGRFLIVAAMVFVVGLLQVANAQRQGMGMPAKERAEALGKDLGVDSAVVVKITAVMEKYEKQRMDKRNELQGDMDGMRAAMMEIRENQTKDIKALLTEEQSKKYDGILKQQMERMQQRQRNN